jgi:hypothetical protein
MYGPISSMRSFCVIFATGQAESQLLSLLRFVGFGCTDACIHGWGGSTMEEFAIGAIAVWVCGPVLHGSINMPCDTEHGTAGFEVGRNAVHGQTKERKLRQYGRYTVQVKSAGRRKEDSSNSYTIIWCDATRHRQYPSRSSSSLGCCRSGRSWMGVGRKKREMSAIAKRSKGGRVRVAYQSLCDGSRVIMNGIRRRKLESISRRK